MNDFKNKEQAAKHRQEMEIKAAKEAAAALAGKTVKISAKAGQGGKLFGSVTSKEVAEALGKQLGVEIDKRKIAMDGDIKAFGTYEAQVRLYTGITADIYVLVGE